ncbi:hypothetical protein GGH96_001890 [Coemansia sp. RSA 1972]|nr:hypothetical protein GGH96_001890 [Coemansia sp. RSA 1972]
MSTTVLYDAVADDMQLDIDETQAYGDTVPFRHSFVTRIYAFFSAQLLLVILFSVLYVFNNGLLVWMLSNGKWLRRAVFAIAVAAAYFLDQLPSSRRHTLSATIVFSVGQAHELAIFAAADKSGLVQRMPIDFLVVLVALTACSKYWPNIVHNIPHYVLSSQLAFPLVAVLTTLISFEPLQLEAARFIIDILLLLLITFYTTTVVEKYSDEHIYVAAVKLYYNTMLRTTFVVFCVAAMVNRFTL